jgi:hypothetical protein
MTAAPILPAPPASDRIETRLHQDATMLLQPNLNRWVRRPPGHACRSCPYLYLDKPLRRLRQPFPPGKKCGAHSPRSRQKAATLFRLLACWEISFRHLVLACCLRWVMLPACYLCWPNGFVDRFPRFGFPPPGYPSYGVSDSYPRWDCLPQNALTFRDLSARAERSLFPDMRVKCHPFTHAKHGKKPQPLLCAPGNTRNSPSHTPNLDGPADREGSKDGFTETRYSRIGESGQQPVLLTLK